MNKQANHTAKLNAALMPTDVLTTEQRRLCMSRIRGKNTRPEKLVRKLIFGMGYRYRLHYKELSGKPDLTFIGRRKVIFVHGCFWHMHDCRYGRVYPKTNEGFWKEKRCRTVERDRENQKALREAGWQSLIIWECETSELEALQQKIRDFLQ